jgi:hypothetical protein
MNGSSTNGAPTNGAPTSAAPTNGAATVPVLANEDPRARLEILQQVRQTYLDLLRDLSDAIPGMVMVGNPMAVDHQGFQYLLQQHTLVENLINRRQVEIDLLRDQLGE